VARNRQRAKQRQAERRARRIAREEQGGVPGAPPEPRARPAEPEVLDPRAVEPAPGIDPSLAVGAPPQDEGRSDTVLEEGPALEEELEDELEDVAIEAEPGQGDGADAYAPRARRGTAAARARERPRVIQFLVAVWAELQRVQWPGRQALITLTAVVLAFILVVGGYLGLLDTIFSRLINAIL
jgi:preprotein translocase subunit SecE